MFEISSGPIDVATLQGRLKTPASGGFAAFEGWVRDHNEGKRVAGLEYEAYPPMAVKEGRRILEEASRRFGIHAAACAHRVGPLAIGDLAVWVGVSAAHRGEAFDACRYIIDQVKLRVPIWKKEHYVDGDSGWVNCEGCASHAHHLQPSLRESEYYARQTCLSEVGAEGQARLRESRVLVVGAGGLGSPVLSYLAAAGVGHLGICEFDRLEPSNLHRQVLFAAADVGMEKARLAAKRLGALNPFIAIRTHDERLTWGTASTLFGQYDLIIDCTDNFPTKFLINDVAVKIGRPVVFSSIYQFEGQLQCYDPVAPSPCLRCLWPDVPEPGAIGSCADVGVLGAVPGVFGALQAMEALKALLGLPGALKDEMILFNLLDYRIHKLKTKRSETCPACGGAASSTAPTDFDVELDIDTVVRQGIGRFEIIDIREENEGGGQPSGVLPTRHLPAGQWDLENPPLARDARYLLCCARGQRSRYLAIALRRRGYHCVYSLSGGLPALRNRRDTSPIP